MEARNRTATTMNTHHGAARLILLSAFFTCAQAADEPSVPPTISASADGETFKGPEILRSGNLAYPVSESSEGNEGWVVLDMMIDPKGKPYEVTVVDSTGNPAFEKTALRGVQYFAFAPAIRDGTPIDSSFTLKIKFAMSTPQKGAHQEFVRAYRRATKAIEAGERAKADEEMRNLKVENLYEDAFLNLANYYYHRKWGTEADQLADLRRAVAGERRPQYLERATFLGVLTALLNLEVRGKDYGAALATWKILQPFVAKKDLPAYLKTIDQIVSLQNSDSAVRMSAQITKGTAWYGQLFKKNFQIAVASGKVSEIKLRCEEAYLIFRYDPQLQYKVDARGGDCSIEIVGDPGTKFDLIQS